MHLPDLLCAVLRLQSGLGDRQDKAKTSTPRDMLHLHYYLSVLSQEYAGLADGKSYSACYSDSQQGPVTADGALEKKLESNGCAGPVF